MGMTFGHVAFDGSDPTLSHICSAMTAICGLPVIVVESDADRLHELDAHVAFKFASDATPSASTYRRGALREFCDEAFGEPALNSFVKNIATGANEPAGKVRRSDMPT